MNNDLGLVRQWVELHKGKTYRDAGRTEAVVRFILAALPKEEPVEKPMSHAEGWVEFADVWQAIDKMQERIDALEARR